MKVLFGAFKRQVTLFEEKLMAQKLTLNGRQLAFLVWDKCRRDIAEIGLSDFFELRGVQLLNDDLIRFLSDWDSVMFGLLNDQDPLYVLSLFDEQIRKCTHFKQSYNAYKIECTHRGLEHNYTNLRYWVDSYVDGKNQDKIKAQLLKQDTLQAAAGVKGGAFDSTTKKSKQGICYQFLENNGRCSRKDCPYPHDYEQLKTYNSSKGKGKSRGKSSQPGGIRSSGGKGKSRSPSSKGKGKGKGKDSKPSLRSGNSRTRERSPHPNRGESRGRSAKRGELQADGRYRLSSSRTESRGTSPSGTKNRMPCAMFLQGKCNRGANCDL